MTTSPAKPSPADRTPSGGASSARRYIRDLDANEFVSGVFCVVNAQLGRTKVGKPFLKCLIKDKTGELPARMWSIDPVAFKRIPTEGFVFVEGQTQPYQGELQFIISAIDRTEPTPDQLRELLPVSESDPAEMLAELKGLLDTVRHPALKALVAAYLDDQPLLSAFTQCPAAKSMHHAYLGGLLEHTLNLVRIADRLCPLYPALNRDIVMVGLFLHDLGKTRELMWDRSFGYTDRGELIGHIVEGAIMLHDKVDLLRREKGVRLPKYAAMVLQHIILSHHGVPEFGAAKVPMTPEAIFVSMLDNLDAKTNIALSAARPNRESPLELGGNFTEKQWALETKLFRPDPLGE
jgi:3'-5' exoribonuclease